MTKKKTNVEIPKIPISEKSARTVAEFCARNNLSRPMFYKLKRRGEGPRVVYVGVKPLITDEDERAWLRGLQAAAAEKAWLRELEAEAVGAVL
jgi:hypothetical protein